MKVAAYSPGWVSGRQLTREERTDVQAIKATGICALCRQSGQRLVFEHDHNVGIHAGRGMTCQSCNAGHMAGIDAGRYAIDMPTRHYLMYPWHLARLGLRLPYDPRIHIAVVDLDADDREALDSVSDESDAEYQIRKVRPQFGHPRLTAALTHGDIRPILRLQLMNRLGFISHDIAEIADRRSAFQREHLAHVLADYSSDWAIDAADVFRLPTARLDFAADAA